MLSFDLNSLKQSSGSGGGFDAVGLASNVASVIPVVGGFLSKGIKIVDGLFGGVDYAKDVAPVMKERLEARMNHVKNVLSDSSLSEAQRLTKADALLVSYIDWAVNTKKEKKSGAWNKGYDLQITNLRDLLNDLRQKSASHFEIDTSVKNISSLGLLFYTGNPFSYKWGTSLPFGVYTQKQGVSSNAIKTMSAPSLATSVRPSSDTSVDTSYGVEAPKTSTGLIAGIVAVALVVIGGIVYLFKKKKK